jgi:hypothetical protein
VASNSATKDFMFGVGQINTSSSSDPDQVRLLLTEGLWRFRYEKSANKQRVDVRRDEDVKGTML